MAITLTRMETTPDRRVRLGEKEGKNNRANGTYQCIHTYKIIGVQPSAV